MTASTAGPVPCTEIYTDTETTSLARPYRPGGRRIWELAVIRREADRTERRLHKFIRLADLDLIGQLPPELRAEHSLSWAERLLALPEPTLEALDVGDFFRRHPEIAPGAPGSVISEVQAAATLLEGWLTAAPGVDKPWLFGIVPSFEDLGYEDLLYRTGFQTVGTPWHYAPQDAATYAAGRLGLLPPWESDEVSRMLGLDPEEYDRHTAMGDAEWTKDLMDMAVLNAANSPSTALAASLGARPGERPEMSAPASSVAGA